MTLRASHILRVPGAVARAPHGLVRAWTPPVRLVVALAVVVALRWAGTRAGLSPLVLGTAFGAVLVGLAWRWPALPSAGNLVIGAVVGIGLVALTTIGTVLSGAILPPGAGRPAAPFVPWVAATLLVATGEEAFLRGRLFDVTRRAGGTLGAVAVTTIAFALLHVPLYGWHVVPLDLAVGLGFAGLRLVTRGVAAPAAAHAVADLATWWL